MASNAAKAATRGDVRDLRNLPSVQAEVSEIHQTTTWPQDRLVAIAPKNKRSRYEVRLRTCSDGRRRVVLALREQNGIGGFRDHGPTVTFAPEHIYAIHELLDSVSLAALEEGLLS